MGFFLEKAERKQAKRSGGKSGASAGFDLHLETLHRMECKVCPLNKIAGNLHPHMEPTGSEKPVVYMLGEAPGKDEDKQGKQFVGESGQLLRTRIPKDWLPHLRWNNTIRCFPGSVNVVVPSEITKLYRRRFSGPLTIISTKMGDKLPCTPHHPILTSKGWVFAYALKKGNKVVNYGSWIEWVPGCYPDKQDKPTTLDELFTTRAFLSGSERMIDRGLNFHGDWATSEVDVVTPNSQLRDVINPSSSEFFAELGFNFGDMYRTVLQCACARFSNSFLSQVQPQAQPLAEAALPFFFGSSGNPNPHLLRCVSDLNVVALKERHKCTSFYTEFAGKLLAAFTGYVPLAEFLGGWRSPESPLGGIDVSGLPVCSQHNSFRPEDFCDPLPGGVELFRELGQAHPGLIHLDEITDVNIQHYDGFLYNLETRDGWFIAHNHIVSNTRPPENRTPTQVEIACCTPSIVRDLEATKPIAIFGFGAVPLRWALGSSADKMALWRGRRMPIKVGKHVCWFFPMYHPAYILRVGKGRKWRGEDPMEWLFDFDLQRAFASVEHLPEPKVEDPADAMSGVEIIDGHRGFTDLDRITRLLEYFASIKETIGIDLETNMLRPYGDGAKILSAAIGTYDYTVAFPIHHRQAPWTREQKNHVLNALRAFVESPAPKVAHNAGFELEWLCRLFGREVGWLSRWEDTMGQAFVLDERQGERNNSLMSLDALCLMNMGLRMKDLIKVDRKQIDYEPLDRVLPYNALDVKYCHKLFHIQKERIAEEELESAYEEHRKRVPTLVGSQLLGLDVDFKEVKKHSVLITDKVSEIMGMLNSLKEVQDFRASRGGDFNPNRSMDVCLILHKHLGFEQVITENGGYSSEENILETIDHPFAELILEYRGYAKAKGTYLDGFEEPGKGVVWPDGRIHTVFHAHRVVTGRTSSEGPNIQNFPRRKGREIRSIIKAPKGYVLVCADQGQIEFRVMGMASRDKTICQALWERYDVHQEWAEKLAYEHPEFVGGKKFLKDTTALKKARDLTKNQFVFPSFYGSIPKSISAGIGLPLNVIEKVQREFWKVFSGYREWLEKQKELYREQGYVECLTGRRHRAPLKTTELVNYPIQGTASDIVVDAMNRLAEYSLVGGGDEFYPRINEHDSLGFYVRDDKHLDDKIGKIATMMLDSQHAFINVPLSVEVSLGPNWADQKEIGRFFSDEILP